MYLIYWNIDSDNNNRNTGKNWIKCQTKEDCHKFIKENGLKDYDITCDASECYRLKNTVKYLSDYLENALDHVGAYVKAWHNLKDTVNTDTDY